MRRISEKYLKRLVALLAVVFVASEVTFYSESIFQFCSEAIVHILNNSFLESVEAAASQFHFLIYAFIDLLNTMNVSLAILIGAAVSLYAVFPAIRNSNEKTEIERRDRQLETLMLAVMLQAEIRRLKVAAERRLAIEAGNQERPGRVPTAMPVGEVYEAHLFNIVRFPEELTKDIVDFYSTLKDAELSRQMAEAEAKETTSNTSKKINTQSYVDQMGNAISYAEKLGEGITAYRLKQGDVVEAVKTTDNVRGPAAD